MKKLFVLLFLFGTTMSCKKDSEIEPTVDTTIENSADKCLDEDFHIDINIPSIEFSQDTAWLSYIHQSSPINIIGERQGYLSWSFPGWSGSSNLIFNYPNEGLQVGAFEVEAAGGVLDFDGTTGIMIVCPCDLTVEITQLDEEAGYCCGTMSGEVTDQNGDLVNMTGNFKAVLDF